MFDDSLQFVTGRRADYIPISKQYQILNHQNDSVEFDSGTKGSNSSSSATSSIDHLPNAPNPIIYTLYGYKCSTVRKCLYHMISVIFLGIPYLISNLSLSFYVWLKFSKCDLSICDIVLSE